MQEENKANEEKWKGDCNRAHSIAFAIRKIITSP